ncbi:MAG: tRNA pseudouridine(13) synthase TruD [Thermoplasmata archaeon]
MDFSEIGVSGYYFELPPSGGKLREKSEDFYVEEQFENLDKKEDGNVLVLKLKAKNWEHNRLIRFVARSNHVSPNRIYFAGTKDRRSVKIQYLSIPGVKYREFSLNDVEILEHFYLDSPLAVGTHSRNHFVIKVSNSDENIFASNCRVVQERGVVPNFYGPQRFGSLRPVTHLVGREIVKGNYQEAVRIFVGYPGQDRFANVRKEYYDNPDPEEGLKNFPESLDLEREVMQYLLTHPNDYSGAIKILPGNLVSMFVHAYQGYMFNRILSRRLELSRSLIIGDIYRENNEFIKVNSLNIEKMNSLFEKGVGSPTGLVVGFDTLPADGKMGEIENEIIEQESISTTNFKLPFGLSSKGERRDLFLRFENMGCNGSTVEFSLPPGGYATSVLREIMRMDEMANY